MKKILTLLTLASAFIFISNAAESTWENRPVGFRDNDGASEWWTTTWRTGDHLETYSKYRFYGRLLVRKDDKSDLKWYSIVPRFLETDHEVDIQGNSFCANNVLAGDMDGEVQIIRSFECPISIRGASVVGLKGGDDVELNLAEAYTKFYNLMQNPEIKNFLRKRIDEGKKLLAVLVNAGVNAGEISAGVPPIPGQDMVVEIIIDRSVAMIEAFATRRAEQIQKNALEKLADGYFDGEGGVEMKKNSIFYKELKKENAKWTVPANWAVTVNNLFDGKEFYLCARKGEKMYAKQLKTSKGEESEALSIIIENQNSIRSIPSKIEDLEPTKDEAKVAKLLSRETFNVNALLFDLRERKVGDAWLAPAKLLNNFLHPDLKGSFKGMLCLKYEGNETISLSIPEVINKKFNARHIRMIEHQGNVKTNLEYHEPPHDNGAGEFLFSYSSGDDDCQAEIDIWVDIESGYIIKVDATLEGKVKYLPDLLLTRGWSFKDGNGIVKLDIESESWPSKISNHKSSK